jgi:DNA-binding beta-propeller fold protein YncE
MPSRIAIGPDGRVYICETTSDRVRVLQPNGEDGGSFSVPKPISVAVSADRIAVGSVAGFAVYDKDGKILGVNGSRGKGPDQFDYVHGIAFGPDGSIYVSDSYNNRLSAYEPDGKRRWMIRTGAPSNSAEIANNMLASKAPSDTALKGADVLQLPLGLTVDGAGRVVVIDMYDCTMAVFEPKTGKFIGKYGDSGAEDGQFFYPVSVSYDSGRDWFTVADALNRRVQIVRIPGSSSGAGGAAATFNRALTSPWRACLFPLLLLLLMIAAFFIARFIRRRRAQREADELESSAEASGE